MARSDRRVQYTKQVIKESLFLLITTVPFHKITVKLLCEKAGINRATFYSHYETMDSLLEEIEREKSTELFERFNGMMSDEDNLRATLVQIVHYLKIHPALREIFLKRNIGGKSPDPLIYGHQHHTIEFIISTSKLSRSQAEWIFVFIISGIKEVLGKWFADGMNDEELLIDTIVSFIYTGISGIKGAQKQ